MESPRTTTTARRILVGAGDVLLALGVVFEPVACWFALTLFPHATCALLGGTGLLIRFLARRPQSRPWGRWLWASAGVLVAFGLIVVGTEIVGHGLRSQRRLQSKYLSSTFGGMLWRTLNVIPEGDLALLGVKASGLLGVWPRAALDRLTPDLRRQYRAMRRSPDFGYVGNVATSGFIGSGNRHFFRYYPRGYSPDRKWPLLVFLHGASGNVALYPWLWSLFADERGFVILCPTWDNGEWWQPDGVQLALDALDDTLKSCAIDGRRIFLAGHSNGSAGGWDVLAARPRAFRGFIAISGGNPARGLAQDVAGIPVLLLHGTADDATPAAASREFCRRLAAAGRRVELVEIQGEDHFLLLRSMAPVGDAVWGWMNRLQQPSEARYSPQSRVPASLTDTDRSGGPAGPMMCEKGHQRPRTKADRLFADVYTSAIIFRNQPAATDQALAVGATPHSIQCDSLAEKLLRPRYSVRGHLTRFRRAERSRRGALAFSPGLL